MREKLLNQYMSLMCDSGSGYSFDTSQYRPIAAGSITSLNQA